MHSFNEHDSLNKYNERLQQVGDICLNLDYWDCEYKNDYIHPIRQQVCKKCDTDQEDSPSSRENEVNLYIHNISSPSGHVE